MYIYDDPINEDLKWMERAWTEYKKHRVWWRRLPREWWCWLRYCHKGLGFMGGFGTGHVNGEKVVLYRTESCVRCHKSRYTYKHPEFKG